MYIGESGDLSTNTMLSFTLSSFLCMRTPNNTHPRTHTHTHTHRQRHAHVRSYQNGEECLQLKRTWCLVKISFTAAFQWLKYFFCPALSGITNNNNKQHQQ